MDTTIWIDKGSLKDWPKLGIDVFHLLICAKCGCMYRTRKLANSEHYINANFCPNCGRRVMGLTSDISQLSAGLDELDAQLKGD